MAASPSFTKILIANRGEIAVRVARSARALGYATVAVFSDADRDAPHVASCDEAVHLGPTPAAESYLAVERVVAAARRAGAGAVHPGHGFLAENAAFARACRDAGLVFVGPDPEVIELMGDKARAKAEMAKAGVPSIPGYDGADPSPEAFAAAAAEIGYPVLVKAVAGGGGRGMRRVRDAAELPDALERARSEAAAAFGDGRLMLEKLLGRVRHVEVQIFGDRHGRVIHLGERDCSVQRRHQKVLEESPSPAVDAGLRRRMGDAAVAAGRALGYSGAGTVEFLLGDDGDFFFLEMNTRLQVEHPVTELVTGLDLVAWQLRVAVGEPLPLAQDDVTFRGHAIEARLYAEDPAAGFLPRPGTVVAWRPPAVPGVRVDHGLASGSEIPAAYDPMIAKLVAHGETREEARRRLLLALGDAVVLGPVTNRRFLGQVLSHPVFVRGEATTSFLDDETSPADFAARPPTADVLALAALLLSRPGLEEGPSDALAGWRNTARAAWPAEIAWDDGDADLRVTPEGGSRYRVEVRAEGLDAAVCVELLAASDGRLVFDIDGHRRSLAFARDGGALWLDERRFASRVRRPGAAATASDGHVAAPMSGRIRAVRVAADEECEEGQTLMVLEAMKLETPIAAPFAGRVEAVLVKEGEQVTHGQALAVIRHQYPSNSTRSPISPSSSRSARSRRS